MCGPMVGECLTRVGKVGKSSTSFVGRGQESPEGREASSEVVDGEVDRRSKGWMRRRGGLEEGEVGFTRRRAAFGLCLSDWVRVEGLSSMKNASTGERGVDSGF